MVQIARHLSRSAGQVPGSRLQALLPTSLTAAVVITATSRAPAIEAHPQAGLDCVSSRRLQGVRSNPNLASHHFQRWAVRGKQPRYRLVFECLSVSSQVRPSSPPRGLFYGGDNYSDAGVHQIVRNMRFASTESACLLRSSATLVAVEMTGVDDAVLDQARDGLGSSALMGECLRGHHAQGAL